MSANTLVSATDLAGLESYASSIGVDLELSLAEREADTIIWLGQIHRTSGQPGAGRRVISRICEVADETELPICASVVFWNSQLIDFYATLGFQVIAEPEIGEDYAVLERLPH